MLLYYGRIRKKSTILNLHEAPSFKGSKSKKKSTEDSTRDV